STRVHEIIRDPPLVVGQDDTVGEVLTKMRDLRIRVVPVVSNGRLVGVVSYKGILMSGVGRTTKVRSVMEPPYGINFMSSVDDAIAKFVLWKAKASPVVDEGNRLVGYLSRGDLMNFLLVNGLLPKMYVKDVMTSPAVTIEGSESIARARWLMLRNGISRLPVINRLGGIEGVISMTDIVERIYIIRLTRRKGFEQFEEEFLAAPVKEFMSAPPIYVTLNQTLEDVVKTLSNYGITGMPVVSEGKVVGVVSGVDVLKAYARQLIYEELVEAKIPQTLKVDGLVKSQVETLVNEYLSDIRRVTNVINFSINLREESKGGRKRYVVRTRLVCDDGVLTSEGVGWDLLSAVRDSLETLEKRIKKLVSRGKELRRSKSRRET
ncbi:MAG: CBS domain-containing protein, partial [Sulfolobales archaeon]